MMLTKEQEVPVHQAAVKFAIACYEAPERPRGSAILAAAEELACRLRPGLIAAGPCAAQGEPRISAKIAGEVVDLEEIHGDMDTQEQARDDYY